MRPTSFRMLLIPASLIVLVGLLGPGTYLHHLLRQRMLQNDLASIENVSLHGDGEPWLAEWLPDGLSGNLPKPRVHLAILHADRMDACLPLSRQLDGVATISISTGDKLTDRQWQLVVGQPQLERLFLDNLQVGDGQIQALAGHRRLRELGFRDVPLSDAALSTLATLPELERLLLQETAITGEAIDAFAIARPDVVVGWVPATTLVQEQHVIALRGFGIYTFLEGASDEIVHKPARTLCVRPDVMLTPEALECIQGLGGVVHTVMVESDLTPEVMDLIYRLPDVAKVYLSDRPISAIDADRLTMLSLTKNIDFSRSVFTDEQRAELQKPWGDKLPQAAIGP
jgi:hypothetical protein